MVAAAAGLLVLGACSTGRDASSPVPTLPTAPTTVGDVTTTTATPVNQTTPPRSPTTRPREPRVVDGVPQVTASPARGRIGDTVHIEGFGFTDAHWKAAGASLWLSGDVGDCALYASAQHSVRVTADGHLSGHFTVPARGECRQSDVGDAAVVAGSYRIVYACTACTVGKFEVTGSPLPSAKCRNVAFSPQSEDAASSIVATGLPCDKAETFVRRLGPMVSANGPARTELDGFQCVLTRHEEDPIPQGFYECTNGSIRITFVRS
ncbi:MAG TPA: hypothetical protein VHG90_12230 [Acidimicrobiales bacterium]|nr:hypothetical protein [Acidimicrobiales bacterium]